MRVGAVHLGPRVRGCADTYAPGGSVLYRPFACCEYLAAQGSLPREWGVGGLLYLPAARVPYVSHTSGQPRWEASQHGTQDASNLTDAGGNLVLSFGVNDCESRLGKIDLAQVWSMLAPLTCATPPCAACVEV